VKYTSPEFDTIDWERWLPEDRATLLFMIDKSHILLIRKKRGLGAGKINGPGGRIEPGESPLDCACRELEEELGVRPAGVPEHRGELSFQFVDGYRLHVHVFSGSAYTGVPCETEEAVPLLTPLDEIPYREMWADDRYWLPMLLEGKRFRGFFLFDGDHMVDFRLDEWKF
jgi:8-oxo-dGTP diphosphatase